MPSAFQQGLVPQTPPAGASTWSKRPPPEPNTQRAQSSVSTGSPKSVVCVAWPLFHLKVTWSPESGILSFSCRMDLAGRVVSLHAVRGPITQPPIGKHVWHSGQVCNAPPPHAPSVQVSGLVHASLSSQPVPLGLKVHVVAQQEANVPFAGPSSHSSV